MCVGVLALGLLSACDSVGDEVTADGLRDALLVSEDLSDEFRVSTDEDDGDDTSPEWGCLLDFENDLDEAGGDDDSDDDDISVSLEPHSEPGMPGVIESITRSDDEEEAEQALAAIAELMSRCHSVDADDGDARWQFTVESDRVAWADGVEQQVNMLATGTATFASIEIPVSMSFSLMRVDNVTTMVIFMDMASDIEEARRDVIDVAMQRVHAAIDGEDQPDPANVLDGYPIGEEFADLLGQTSGA